MPILTPTGVLLGFLFAPWLSPLRFLVPWLFALMTLAGAMNLRARELGRTLARPVPILLFFLFSHAFMPLAALLTARLFNPGDPDVAAGFVLLFSIPTAVTGFIWVSIYRGDGALCLALILLDSLAAPFVVPATVNLLLGTTVALDTPGMMVSLAIMIVLPTLAGVAINEASRGKVPYAVGPYLGVASKTMLMLVVAINSSSIVHQLDLGNPRIYLVALQSILLGFLGFVAGRVAGALGRYEDARIKALLFSVGLRNISAAATIAVAFFPAGVALPAILGMLFQQVLASLAGKVLLPKRPGGSAPPPDAKGGIA